MSSQKQANYIINIGIHIYILFTFLTIFFFLYASKLAKKSINRALSNIIDKETNKFLTQLNTMDKKIAEVEINWDNVNKIAQKIEQSSQGELSSITEHNERLRKVAISIVIGLGVFLVLLYLYFRLSKGYKIKLGNIILENLVIFTFIGIIEYLFFTRIASKYIPTTPDFVVSSILDRVKYQIAQRIYT